LCSHADAWHGGDHPAVERSAARRRESLRPRPALQRTRPLRAWPRPGTARIRRLPRQHGRLPGTVR
jgi:hypothetical protein